MNPTEKDPAESPISKNPSAMRPARKRRSFSKLLLLLISYAVVAAVAWNIASQWEVDPAKQQARADQEVRNTVNQVRKLMVLPDPNVELPQVAIINDAESLSKTQAFFADVKNGDQVLIYLTSQKAIIYRASENKIVNVGPVIREDTPSAVSGSNSRPAVTPAPTTTERDSNDSTGDSGTSSSGVR